MSWECMALVFDAKDLKGPEKLQLLVLARRADAHGYCWPGIERQSEDSGTSIATVKRANNGLEERNLIKRVRRSDPRTGRSRTNLYRINMRLLASMKRPPRDYQDDLIGSIVFDNPELAAGLDEDRDEPTKYPEKGLSTGPELPIAQSEPLGAQSEPLEGLNLNPNSSYEVKGELKEELKNSSRASRSPVASLPDRFDEFYQIYPRKIAKAAAKRAWAKVKDGDKEKALSAVAKFRDHTRSFQTETQFIPHPASWLNGERWLDDLTESDVPRNGKPSGLIDVNGIQATPRSAGALQRMQALRERDSHRSSLLDALEASKGPQLKLMGA